PSLPIKALSFCRPTELRGKGGAPATKGGLHFLACQGGCMVLAAKGGIKNDAGSAVPRQRSDTI
ncbi:hypothetical protein, partial [Dialister succinatiphilus]|uniref:hypothetical protein n=1 Tax=Dialister succinatiphilus TaxID=487173 RepID=UPI003F82268F